MLTILNIKIKKVTEGCKRKNINSPIKTGQFNRSFKRQKKRNLWKMCYKFSKTKTANTYCYMKQQCLSWLKEKKFSHDKSWLTEFLITKPALQEILEGILQTKEKENHQENTEVRGYNRTAKHTRNFFKKKKTLWQKLLHNLIIMLQ